MPLISFIVPVYRVEKYLDQCVQSLLLQNSCEFEIVLVDDGSPDKCPDICDSYAKKYANVKVIHQENGGLSAARNTGIKASSGRYILFVDSDDYIGPGFLEAIVDKIRNNPVDVVFLDAVKVYSNGNEVPLGYCYERLNFKNEKAFDILNQLSRFSKYPSSACDKLFSRQLLLDYQLCFAEGLLYEDIDFTLGVFQYARSFDYYHVPYYFYRQHRSGSITNTIGAKHVVDLFSIITKWASNKTSQSNIQKAANAIMAYEYCVLLGFLHKAKREVPPALVVEIYRYRWLLKFGRNRKITVIWFLSTILGIRATTFILGIYLKTRKL